MSKIHWFHPPLMLLGLLLAACSGQVTLPQASVTPRLALTPYQTATQTAAPSGIKTLPATFTPAPLPTATPFTYTVVKGDTMLAVALRHGIPLEDLLAANPQVDPRFLSVGVALVIPLGENVAEVLPTPTPAPVELSEPRCYAIIDGGAWCFAQVSNPGGEALENISALLTLYGQTGQAIESKTAVPPLNLLKPEASLPLAVFFPAPLPADFQAQVQLLSALVVRDVDQRYAKAEVEIFETAYNAEKTVAGLTGEIVLGKKAAPARLIWVAATAYDAQGNVVGVRKWEAGPYMSLPSIAGTATITVTIDPASTASAALLQPGGRMPFGFEVYSLGPEIARVDLQVEARP